MCFFGLCLCLFVYIFAKKHVKCDSNTHFVVLQFRFVPGAKLIFMPQQGSANSLYDSVLDDHDGGDSAGVASGFDPSGGEPAYQFGTDWDP